jgi:6-phosphogluconolactonase
MKTRRIQLLAWIIFITSLFFSMNCLEKDKIITKDNTYNSNVSMTYTTKTDTSKIVNAPVETEKCDLLFIGTYTQLIYVYKMDTLTGALSQVCTSPQTSNPSYLAIHFNKKWLYAVNEYSGTISSFSFDSVQNQITFINSMSSQGDDPCYVSIDKTGRYVMTANYNSGSVAVLPIGNNGALGQATSVDQHSGSGPVAGRQDGPHAHMIIQADNHFVYNTDLGIDKILIYTLDTINGKIQDIGKDASAISGAGPRHIAFHPTKPWMYVVCELNGTVEAFTVDNSSGALTRFQTISTLSAGDTSAAASADIHITPDGKYLYASNRGEINNIAIYAISQDSGKLSLLGHQSTLGRTPRSFVIDPTGTFLLVANQDDNNIVTFKINSSNGLLIETGIQTSVPSPVCLKFLEVHEKKVSTGIRNIHL